jgi:two-component system KDP operon response regulator KdpE
MARLLLVDDDGALVDLLAQHLALSGHEVKTAASGAEALRLAAATLPELVLLDVTMPGMDGWQVLAELRASCDVPVIMLTAKAEEPDVLRAFGLGADDYVVKPFSVPQLDARIRAVLHRHRGVSSTPPGTVLRGAGLTVDTETRRVTRGDSRIHLTPTEFRLLVALIASPGTILSPEHLVRVVWGEAYAAESDYVRRYIWYLRRKIEADPERPRVILNERNVGYYFAES